MKQALLLLEMLLSFVIMGTVFLFSALLYHDVFNSTNAEFEQALTQMDLLSTELFLAKKFQEGVILDHSSQKISFYEISTQEHIQGFYSGIIDLTQSSKEKIYTPLSQTTKLNASFIIFNDKEVHELIKSPQNNYLYFKNSSPKTLYEQYKIIKQKSLLELKESRLYYNGNILQNEVTHLEIKPFQNRIQMNLCLKNICQEWLF